MSSYRPTYAPDERNRPSPIDRNPNYGQQQSSQQPSFKTNVNRMKTKRWVNAKTYSYDGDDWGESDDDDDYDDDEANTNQPPYGHKQSSQQPTPRSAPAVPALPTQHAGNLPCNQEPSSAVGVSMSQRGQSADAPAAIPPQPGTGQVDSKTNDEQDSSESKPLPFIRPADIYKRLAEQKEKERLQALGPATNSQNDTPRGTVSNEPSVSKINNASAVEHGAQNQEGLAVNETKEVTDQDPVGKQQPTHSLTSAPEAEPASQLLQIKHLSVFGQDFMGGTLSDEAKTTEGTSANLDDTSQDTSIPRNASPGFRSAVHQAFDAPDTPATTTTGSIARTDSEASTISPIIHPNTLTAASNIGTSSTNQTPTIEEEPSEQVQTPRQSQLLPADFKPGHRRSLTPPNSENGPAKKPTLTTNIISPDSERVDVGEEIRPGGTLGHSRRDASPSHSDTGNKEFYSSDTMHSGVSPSVNSNSSPRPETRPSSTSTDKKMLDSTGLGSGEEEKRRSLNLTVNTGGEDVAEDAAHKPPQQSQLGTPHGKEAVIDNPTHSDSPASGSNADISSYLQVSGEPRSRIGHESTLIPSEYDSYWSEQGDENIESLKPLPLRPTSADRQSAAAKSQEGQSSAPADDVNIATIATINNGSSNNNPNSENHQVQRKFSWELEGGPGNPPQGPLPPLPGQKSSDLQLPEAGSSSVSSVQDPPRQLSEGNDNAVSNDLQLRQESSKPATREASPEADGAGSAKDNDQKEEITESNNNNEASTESLAASGVAIPPSNPFDNRKAKNFSDISKMEPRTNRIAAFNETREIFADGDMRLGSWIQHMADNHPEHADLIAKNGAPQGPVIQRTTTSGKFPKLSSLGSISLPSSSGHHEGASSPHAHTRHPSITPLGGMMNSQQVQAKGKDLLHSAGVFGGKAGGAAKGFFAKGRSKFRHSGSDKAASVPLPAGPQRLSMSDTRRRPDSIDGGFKPLDAGIPHVGPLHLNLEPLSVSMATHSNDVLNLTSEANNSTAPETPFNNPAPIPPIPHSQPQSANSTTQPTGMRKSLENSVASQGSGADALGHTSGQAEEASTSKERPNGVTNDENGTNQRKDTPPSTDHQHVDIPDIELQPDTARLDSTRSGSDCLPAESGSNLENSKGENCESSTSQDNNPQDIDHIPENKDEVETEEVNGSQPVVEANSLGSERSKSPAASPSNPQNHEMDGKADVEEKNDAVSKEDGKLESTEESERARSAENSHISASISSISLVGDSDREEEITIYMSPDKTESIDIGIETPTNNESTASGSATFQNNNNSRPDADASSKSGTMTPSNVPNGNNQGGNRTITHKFSFEEDNVGRADNVPAPPAINHQTAPSSSYRHASLHNPNTRGYYAPAPDAIKRPQSAAQVRNQHHARINSANFGGKPQGMRQQLPTHPAPWDRQRADAGRSAQISTLVTEWEQSSGANSTENVQAPVATTEVSAAGATKSRSRSSSAISGIMSRVSLGRSRGEDAGDGTKSGEKRNNLKFRSLRLDAKNSRDKGPAVGRHTPPPSKPAEQVQEQGDGKRMLYNARRRGSNLVSSTEQEMKEGISKMRSMLARTSHAQNSATPSGQSAAGGNVSSRAPNSAGFQTQSLPTTPQEGNPASRQGRFYRSLNPTLSRLNEQPEPPPHVEEQRGNYRAASQSAGAPLQERFIPYNPISASLGNRYNPPPPPPRHMSSSVVQTSTFSPLSVNGGVGYPIEPPRRAHTADLHIRSRSPISHQPDPYLSSAIAAADNNSTPASQLGMFNSTADGVSRDDGHQQRPWNVTMPRNQSGGSVDDASQYPLPRSNMMSPVNPAAANIPPPPPPKIPLHADEESEPTPAPRNINTSTQPTELPAPTKTIPTEPIEMPTHDDSSEEIVMSSTAYPGQEWQPAYLGHWD